MFARKIGYRLHRFVIERQIGKSRLTIGAQGFERVDQFSGRSRGIVEDNWRNSICADRALQDIREIQFQHIYCSSQFRGSTAIDLNSASRTSPGLALRGLETCFLNV